MSATEALLREVSSKTSENRSGGAPRERRRRIFSSISAGIVMLFALFGFGSICGYYLRNVSQHQVLFCKLFFPSRELPVSIPVEVNVKIAKTTAVTVRLDPELKGRLAQAAAKLDLSENDIVRHALRAAVNAIEANDYKIELPLEMALAKGPIESPP
jgi:predicted transcriptional regulator